MWVRTKSLITNFIWELYVILSFYLWLVSTYVFITESYLDTFLYLRSRVFYGCQMISLFIVYGDRSDICLVLLAFLFSHCVLFSLVISYLILCSAYFHVLQHVGIPQILVWRSECWLPKKRICICPCQTLEALQIQNCV